MTLSIDKNIVVFTKPDCPHCERAKSLLDQKSITYQTIDIQETEGAGDFSIYLSGRSSVPQVFLAGLPAGGADELERFEARGELDGLLEAARGAKIAPLIKDISTVDVSKAIEDLTMEKFIEGSDGTKSLDPEELPLLHFYKMFFGWWPNCYYTLHRYPEAYKAFIYSTLISVAGGQAKELLGEDLLCAIAFATSEAQGCGYCQVHTAATTDHSLGLVEEFREIRAAGANAPSDARFGALDVALAELAGRASTNTVTDETIARIHQLAPEKADEYIKAVGQIASVFGFLNCFNDLTSVEIEGGWNNQVQAAFSVDMGKHAQKSDSKDNPSNLDFDIPPTELSFPAMIGKYEGIVGDDHVAYLQEHLGVAPDWVAKWFGPYQKRHTYMYVSLMGRDGPSPKISAELKHLMARVSAMARGHDYLSATEGYMAQFAAGGSQRAIERVRHSYGAASGVEESLDHFTEAERAALSLAVASAQIPLVTLRKTMDPVLKHYDQDEIVQLFVACGIAGSIQRWCAVAKPETEPVVKAFYKSTGLPLAMTPYMFPPLVKVLKDAK